MRIINIEDFFHPDAGYQINILSKYLSKFGHEVAIVTSKMEKIPHVLKDFFSADNIEEKDKKFTEATGVKIYRVDLLTYKSGRAIAKIGTKKFIDSLKPDILYIHGESSVYAMNFLLHYNNLPYALILDSHMHYDAVTNKCAELFHSFYSRIFAKIINRNKIKVIRVQESNYVQDCLGISIQNSPFISFGSDTISFCPSPSARAEFRKKNDIKENDFVVVCAGKLIESKGADFFAKTIVKKFQAGRYSDVVFVIIGNIPNNEYGVNLEGLYKKSENRILRFPTQKYIDLPIFFQAADIAVIPNEGSLIFFDMQACGLPVIWSDEYLNKERASHGNAFTFKILDEADLREKIEECIEMSPDNLSKISKCAETFIKKSFDYNTIARKFEDIILSEYERQKKLRKF